MILSSSGLSCQHLARARETIAEVSSQWLAVNIGFGMERPARLFLQFDGPSMKQQTVISFRKEEQCIDNQSTIEART